MILLYYNKRAYQICHISAFFIFLRSQSFIISNRRWLSRYNQPQRQGVSPSQKGEVPIVQITPNCVVHFYSYSCSSDNRQSYDRPNFAVNYSVRTRLWSNFCGPAFALALSSSFFAATSTFLLSLSSLLSFIFFLYFASSQYTFSFSIAAFRLVYISGFFTFGCPCSIKRDSLSQSSWISSSTLKNYGLLGSIDRNLNAFSYYIMAVLKSLSSVQIIPIISLISATLDESSPYCSSLSFRARSNISKALGNSPCNLYKMPILYRQSPANCPLIFALFLKHSIALRKYPYSAKQHPTKKQQFDAQYESEPKNVMMILVYKTQYEIQSIPIAQLRLPMHDIKFNFFCKCSQYFYFTVSFCLIDGTSLRSQIRAAFSLRYNYNSCFPLFLSLSSKQVFVSRHTVPPQSNSQSAEGVA